MSTYRGQDGIAQVVTTGGSLAAIAELTDWTLDANVNLLEDTSIGDTDRTYKAGLKGGTIAFTAHWDGDDTAQADLVEGDTIDFKLFPEGNSSGNNIFTGSAIVESVSVNAELESIVGFTANCTITGALTRDTVS